ncbi:hypothetical protein B0H67DRAFT_591072 [Lasiosphaeris hirsuta]|uniref:DNA (cytosine-5-)-methyltransferase n=1 Tax=Lasiosphaeris hirsuta TaxID=260670 RepID=A0AA39ZVG6_9PEZI|nr:hypothetical protein B0H67DRAFT_591072 [Lasiosphaeris hirsuta]
MASVSDDDFLLDFFASDGDDDYSSDDFPSQLTQDNLYPSTHSLGLTRSYVPLWTCVDAFREFYQNWKDAIVASFELNPRDPHSFAPRRTETSTHVQVTVHRQTPPAADPGPSQTQELLGFIRLNKRTGCLELANFKAQLEMRNLSLGGTSKRGQGHDKKFAGVHGEGFKLAALVMRRNGHAVRISSSSYYWNFGFNGTGRDRFYCKLSAPSPATLEKERAALMQETAQGRPRTDLKSYMSEDVMVRISKARGDEGRKVMADAFSDWEAVTLDLKGPRKDGIIRTAVGDLILDPAFAGRVYLKGLCVGRGGPEGKPYTLCYNFAQGYINRDRERLTDINHEASTLAAIWQQPILEGREDIARRYLDLFYNHRHSPDILLADKVVSRAVAETIWRQMQKDAPGAFFYSDGDDTTAEEGGDMRQREIIEMALKKEPKKVYRILWRVLRRYSLVRTPHEERCRLFQLSEPAGVVGGFAQNGLRLVRAAFLLHQKFLGITICVVRGGDTGIDVLYLRGEGQGEEPSRLLIHEKWFNFTTSHEGADCELSALATWDGEHSSNPMGDFYCDHIVLDLFELVMRELRGPLQFDHAEADAARRAFRKIIRQMPRSVEVSTTPRAGELQVTWTSSGMDKVAAKRGLIIQYHITLHQASSCHEQYSDDLFYREYVENIYDSDDDVDEAPCNCPRQIVCAESCSGVRFNDLDPAERYFPMVARIGTGIHSSLFGWPPAPLSPASRPKTPQLSRTRPIALPKSPPSRSTAVPATPHRLLRDRLPDREAINSSDLKRDEDQWRKWHDEELPTVISRLFRAPTEVPGHRYHSMPHRGLVDADTLFCDRLNFEFEQGTFVWILKRMHSSSGDSGDSGVSGDSEFCSYITLIHGLHPGDGEEGRCSIPGPHISVTKYTYLGSDKHSALFDCPNNRFPIDDSGPWGLLMHFSAFEGMGTQYDAEIIVLDDITEARCLPPDFGVLHCANQDTLNVPKNKAFCCFARSVTGQSMAFVPLAPSMLPQQEPWNRPKLRRFAKDSVPYVVDFTPGVLGPAEGFAEAGYRLLCGVGFDGQSHFTWRVRNPTCDVFEGKISKVISDLALEQLVLPKMPPPDHPRVACLASGNTVFGLRASSNEMPSMPTFLRLLEDMGTVVTSSLEFDFTVLQMPVAVLHSASASTLFKHIYTLLVNMEQSVALHIVSHRDHNIHQDRRMLIIVASRYPGLDLVGPGPESNPSTHDNSTLYTLLKDLAINNTRSANADDHLNAMATCLSNVIEEADFTRKNLYNHNTGRTILPNTRDCVVVDIGDPTVVSLSSPSSRPLVHKWRGDLLTVGELARIQGFKDDFLFYGPPEVQNKDVLAAQPPAISKAIAKMLRRVIEFSSGSKGRGLGDGAGTAARGQSQNSSRVNKRARVEDAEDD